MVDWRDRLNGDPLPWLLDEESPAVRHLALRDLLGRPNDDPDVRAARDAAALTDPIASILAAQNPAGWWVKPGAGYSPKYTGTVWQLIFLDQLGADPEEPRVRAACDYVLAHSQARTGGFGMLGRRQRNQAAAARHGDPLPQRQPAAGTHRLRAARRRAGAAGSRLAGGCDHRRRRATLERCHAGRGIRCGANDGLPCGWGAAKALLGLARIPPDPHADQADRARRPAGPRGGHHHLVGVAADVDARADRGRTPLAAGLGGDRASEGSRRGALRLALSGAPYPKRDRPGPPPARPGPISLWRTTHQPGLPPVNRVGASYTGITGAAGPAG